MPIDTTAVARIDGTVAVVGAGPLADHLRHGLAAAGNDVASDVDGTGRLAAAVFAPWDPDEVRPVAFHELSDAGFHQAWQRTLDDAVATAVAARARFGPEGGRLVFVIPTIALAGGAGHAHWAAAAEGVHLLAKSAARQWGPDGITANVMAVGPDEVLGDPDSAGPVSIAEPALPDADPVAVLAFLCGPAAAHIGGQTLVVDGGLWM
ncbi:SDR family oxidoreductase [Rhabdothermincola salaria]|uniref:SDR family oxidoreductase n=1 Tax=Rhabdothermincola salaria TaxID=2903142 RepID=UPI001E635C46|nr:SDR family oxidoreductase [Rhabdothermincola salaria]MCD9622235.1 SDR family oxidoreductase [Rhabdothermincola salaria]